jgi:hypothetical protein
MVHVWSRDPRRAASPLSQATALALMAFAERMERLPLAMAVTATMLRDSSDPVEETVAGLGLGRMRTFAGRRFQHGCNRRARYRDDRCSSWLGRSVCNPIRKVHIEILPVGRVNQPG